MAYEMYMDDVRMPVTPSKLQLKVGGANKTYTLISGSEINVLKSAKLTEISFDLLIPAVKYPFAIYDNNKFKGIDYFLDLFESLKTGKEPFQFIMNRELPNGETLYDTNMKVSLEDYTVDEDADEGFDVTVSIKLKKYVDHGTVTYTAPKTTSKKKKATKKKKRSTSKNAPKTKTYTVKEKGDCLWKIAKKFYGDGSKYMTIYNANKKKIKNPNLIYIGQVFTIP